MNVKEIFLFIVLVLMFLAIPVLLGLAAAL